MNVFLWLFICKTTKEQRYLQMFCRFLEKRMEKRACPRPLRLQKRACICGRTRADGSLQKLAERLGFCTVQHVRPTALRRDVAKAQQVQGGEASILLMAFHCRFLRCLLMSVQETHTVLGQRAIMSREEDCDIMAKGLSAHGRNRTKALPQRFGMLASLYNAHGFHSLADIVDTEDVCPLQK